MLKFEVSTRTTEFFWEVHSERAIICVTQREEEGSVL